MTNKAKFPERRRKRREEAQVRQVRFDALAEVEKQKRRPRDEKGRKVKV